jgi:tryptophan synthase alpha chain
MSENPINGLARIAGAFATARAQNRAALMPYYTLGYPDINISLHVIEAIAQAGADLIELGVPFSDPLADGPTIQHSTQVALQAGITTARCLEIVARLRRAGLALPFLLMGYANPMLAYGLERYVADAAAAGADGFIVPDLPPEEAGALAAACRAKGLALVCLLAPTASEERAAYVAAQSTGFLYLVSVTGVTGARQEMGAGLVGIVSRVRNLTMLPLAVGFGVSTPAQAASTGRLADGVIVGSALINAVDRGPDPVMAARTFVGELRQALMADPAPVDAGVTYHA